MEKYESDKQLVRKTVILGRSSASNNRFYYGLELN